jgi:hypothetical protein
MKKPGQVALVPFPRVDLTPGKPRPVLLLAVRLHWSHRGRTSESDTREVGEFEEWRM